MSAQLKQRYTPEEYLAIERKLESRHEYYQGEMFAMSGASREHNLISMNIAASLHRQFANQPCEVYQHDMRVKVTTIGMYVYPDVVATCKKPRFEDDTFDTLLNPQLIVEVLSESTEGFDRGMKFESYRKIESLHEYLLVDQNRPHIEHYSREHGPWVLSEAHGLESALLLPAVNCRLDLADVYAKVDFPAAP